MKINLALVEDRFVAQSAIDFIVLRWTAHCGCVYECWRLYLAAFDTLAVDVVIMDINLPGKSGIYAVERLKPLHEKVQFLMCTIYEDEEHIFQALCAGASGYILKHGTGEIPASH